MPDEWIDDGDDNYDMAVCTIPEPSFAQLAVPLPVRDTVMPEGAFPAMAVGFQDEAMFYDARNAVALEEGMVLASDMVQGASGGPWISNGIVVGVTGNASGTDLSSPNNGPSAQQMVAWLQAQ
jgi:hypothetical protein